MSPELPSLPLAQSSEVNFQLHSLGWKSFQELCLTITSETLGQTVQAFASVNDGGRDGAFHGTWSTASPGGLSGSYTIQCKFTSRDNVTLNPSALDDEIKKARRLARKGLATNYILMTNLGVTGNSDEEIKAAIEAIPGVQKCLVYGKEWITRQIRESSRLRMLVPRIYGLGDLSQILDERVRAQAEAILSSMKDDLAKFVRTDAHKRSAEALRDHRFVLLLGEPASGKSTISACLALGAADHSACATLKVKDADDLIEHWNPNEPGQFFWVDDAFGATQYQRESADAWNRAFPAVHAAIKQGAHVLLTSRDYIWRYARDDLKASAFPLLELSQVIIEVQRLTAQEKAQILYNHVKLGDQPAEFRRTIKRFLPQVAASQRFLPETARRLGTRTFTSRLSVSTEGISEFVEKPEPFLVDVLRGLDVSSRAALTVLFMNGGAIRNPLEPSEVDSHTLEVLGVNMAEVRRALQALKGDMVKLVYSAGESIWMLKHPTFTDALATVIGEDPGLLDIYLVGAPIAKILTEVTCGDVGLQGARVVVPTSRYEAFSLRLDAVTSQWSLYDFLSTRCDKSFLEFYTQRRKLLESLLTGLLHYGSTYMPRRLLARLYEFGLLPEPGRAAFVAWASDMVVDSQDADAISDTGQRGLFTDGEMKALLERVADELLPNLDDVIGEWESSFQHEDDPEEHFTPLVSTLETLEYEFANLGEVPSDLSSAIHRARSLADRSTWVDLDTSAFEHMDFSPPEPPTQMKRS
jgi:uncharacterized ferredoxin-like protein